MRHGLFTDAVTRFNKGQSALQNPVVLNFLMKSVCDMAGGEQASDVYDEGARLPKATSISVAPDFINARIGLELSPATIKAILGNVEIGVKDGLTVTPPFWRTDIELPEDIIEEVGRLYGFDKLPRELPQRSTVPAPINGRLTIKQRIRQSLRRAGANEVLTYSFVHERTLLRADQDVSRAYKLSNALSPELQYYRLSVLPSLLDKVNMDIRAGYDDFALFEVGKAHSKALKLDEDGLPREPEYVDFVIAHKQPLTGAPYYHARRMVEYVVDNLGIEVIYRPIDAVNDDDTWAPFDPARSAQLMTRDGVSLGIVGELRNEVRTKFKLPEYVAAASLSIDALETLTRVEGYRYKVLSRFPSISRDISLRVKSDVSYHELFHAVWQVVESWGDELDITVEPVSIYQASEDATHRTTTLHLVLTSSARTLQDGDANPVIDAIAHSAAEALGAELV